eukprot:TRINITY_DN1122_c0_g1_i1.p1 TRINITY_DN1122_c0_g1~~TRINITY_DN1122_c0_g1_i1.p1  ORF type:complete len:290 (-),score=48.01 TRINITY_DN1122_c0_g1_i1:149-1018(-)
MSTTVHIISGSSAGLVSTLMFHPLTLLQTRLQCSNSAAKGIINSVKEIILVEGKGSAKPLFQGLSPALIGSTVVWGAYFCLYDQLKGYFEKTHNYSNAGIHLTCGFLSGAATSVLVNPIFVIKTRMQLQNYNSKTKYSGVSNAFKTIIKEEGVVGLYKGLLPSILETSQGAFQFMFYEQIKQKFLENSENKGLTTAQSLAAGSIAKMFATSISYPIQVVKARTQMKPNPQNPSSNSISNVIKTTWMKEGISGFFKGLGVSLVRVTPGAAVTFCVYETVKNMFSNTIVKN